MRKKDLDQFDRKILQMIQEDGAVELQALASQVCLSSTACWRRIKKLETDGVIVKE